MKRSLVVFYALVIVVAAGSIRCDYLNKLIEQAQTNVPTTKEKMMGVWQVTAATDSSGNSIMDGMSTPPTVFSLEDANSVVSSAGPMFMKIVYGNSNYTSIASQVDQVFHYASLSFTTGEWFVDATGNPDRFTIEMKLQGLPGQKSLTTLLSLIGIRSQFLDATIYHKFLNVQVSFDTLSDSTMTWNFDSQTTSAYNTKDDYGNYVLWNGWTFPFCHYTFVLTKRVKTIQQLVNPGAVQGQ
jgi:hypothetical protein